MEVRYGLRGSIAIYERSGNRRSSKFSYKKHIPERIARLLDEYAIMLGRMKVEAIAFCRFSQQPMKGSDITLRNRRPKHADRHAMPLRQPNVITGLGMHRGKKLGIGFSAIHQDHF